MFGGKQVRNRSQTCKSHTPVSVDCSSSRRSLEVFASGDIRFAPIPTMDCGVVSGNLLNPSQRVDAVALNRIGMNSFMLRIRFLIFFLIGFSILNAKGSNQIQILHIAKSDGDTLLTSVQICLKREKVFSGKTVLEVQYPGRIAVRRLADGTIKTDSFENKEHSILGFNFRGGTQVNEIYLIVGMENSFTIMDNVCSQLSNKLKYFNRVIRPTDLFLDGIVGSDLIISHHNQGSPEGWFDFKVHIQQGKLEILNGSIRDL